MMRQLVWSFYLPYCHAGRQNVVSPGVLRLCCAAEGRTMSGGLSWSPQQATDSGCDVVPDGAGEVLVTRRHRGVRPAYDLHGGPFGDAQDQQHGRRGVSSVVQPRVSHIGGGEQVLPVLGVGAGD